MALQLLRYVTRVWDHHIRQGGAPPLPPVIPLVLYHGGRRWTVPEELSALLDPPPELEPFVPGFRYLLADLTTFADDETVAGPPLVRVPLLLLLHIFDPDLAARIGVLLRPLGDVEDPRIRWEATVSCVYYILNAREEVATDELAETVRDMLPGDEGERVMATVADQLREEGRREGLQQGLQQGAAATARDAVVEVLETRFGPLPEPLRERIDGVEDLEVLRRLHKAALTTASIEAFREALVGTS
ncbi:MAG TPA: Rpn family recombination-promoting nuclease/putative transposase [Candidatus Thermoplasmatota archaeon]